MSKRRPPSPPAAAAAAAGVLDFSRGEQALGRVAAALDVSADLTGGDEIGPDQ